MSAQPEPFACAVVIVVAMSAAGVAHTVWMRSAWSHRFALPLDAGLRVRGKPLLGTNKTWRGFMVMVPASGIAFAAFGALREALPEWLAHGLWPLEPAALFWLGAWAGLCFMAGELPNSLFKRMRGIAPGEVPSRGAERLACLLVDRVDSTLALLIGLSLAVPLPWLAWLWILVFGPVVHLGFSALLYALGVKARLA